MTSQKRERRRAEREKVMLDGPDGPVPLLPILERLSACDDGLLWVYSAGYSTFREAWARCHHIGWLAWLACEVLDRCGDGPRSYACDVNFDWEEPSGSGRDVGQRTAERSRAVLEDIVSPAAIEALLYGYAKNAGWA